MGKYILEMKNITKIFPGVRALDKNMDDISEDNIIKGMVGRKLTDRYPKRTPKIGDVLFSVEN